MSRLRALVGGREGGPPGLPCTNHEIAQANFRVAVPGPGVTRIWLLCTACSNTMLVNIEGAIAAPAWRKHRGRRR